MKKYIYLFIIILFFTIACKTKADVTVSVSSTTTTIVRIDERLQVNINDSSDIDILERQIKGLFDAIEDKIADRDFDGWYASLSDNYKAFLADATKLKKTSIRSPYLTNINVTLNTPQDYFFYVVIPAREGNKLTFRGYDYINSEKIHVKNGIDGLKTDFQYEFIYENDSWKLDR